MSDSSPARRVACPTCGKSIVWSAENRYRPFCCQRCREIDLGAWATEKYRVPEHSKPVTDEHE